MSRLRSTQRRQEAQCNPRAPDCAYGVGGHLSGPPVACVTPHPRYVDCRELRRGKERQSEPGAALGRITVSLGVDAPEIGRSTDRAQKNHLRPLAAAGMSE